MTGAGRGNFDVLNSIGNFDALKKSVIQALFLSGIPFFAYINFVDLDRVRFGIVSFFISSFLCAFSVSKMNIFFERKNLFYFVLSLLLFILGLSYTYIFIDNFIFFSVYILIYINWIAYYIMRKIVFFADILLHTTGGILIFSLGLIWGVGQENINIKENNIEKFFDFLDGDKVLLSLFVSFAFTAGYIIDLIDDMEEDRRIGQKNLAGKIGIKLTFLLSSLMFLVSYINVFPIMKQNISKIIFILLFLSHFSVATILFLFLNNRTLYFIPKYRMFYRALFVIYCILITSDNQKIHLFFL